MPSSAPATATRSPKPAVAQASAGAHHDDRAASIQFAGWPGVLGTWLLGGAVCALCFAAMTVLGRLQDTHPMLSLGAVPIIELVLVSACIGRAGRVTVAGLARTVGIALVPVLNVVLIPYHAGKGFSHAFALPSRIRGQLGMRDSGCADLPGPVGWAVGILCLAGAVYLLVMVVLASFASVVAGGWTGSVAVVVDVLLFVLLPLLLHYALALGMGGPVTFVSYLFATAALLIPVYNVIKAPMWLGRGLYRIATGQEYPYRRLMLEPAARDRLFARSLRYGAIAAWSVAGVVAGIQEVRILAGELGAGGVVGGIVLFPVTLLVMPWRAGIKYDNWMPMLISCLGLAVGFLLRTTVAEGDVEQAAQGARA